LPEDHPFWSHPRVTVFPHVAAPSESTDLAPYVADNIRRFIAGETPRFLV
jgi:glyoxylate/hydroxypyruvate reductase A